jgi:hypothetical protein
MGVNLADNLTKDLGYGGKLGLIYYRYKYW